MGVGSAADAFGFLAEGRWADARAGFEAALVDGETAEACFGLATALWWLGESHACVERCTSAYALFRESGDVQGAARCAVWLAITYKSNFANFAAASGWLARAERLLEPLSPGSLHGWLWVARAYRMTDLDISEKLTARALDAAEAAGDTDLQLVALGQLGHIRVGLGDAAGGFRFLDEAMAAALAGERSTLDTVVYTCCDMLNACELADDLERAAQWCKVADDFVARYGCPFLYAECRIYYGSVLTASGRWQDAERELFAGLRITAGACPGLHAKALTRLAALRIRQGRLEEADQLLARLGEGVDAEAEEALAVAALLLARGDAPGATRSLEHRLHRLEGHRSLLVAALDLLVDAQLAAQDLNQAGATSARLGALASAASSERWRALATDAAGRVAMAAGEHAVAVELLDSARQAWTRLELPFEAARTRAELARLLADTEPEVAVDHARRALATFEELGAARDADRTVALLRSLGVSARTGDRGLGLLSRRERDVLRLLALGLS
ncbi:MAG: LuxR family transcriptional regulator, partial [Actinomycetota bacterium]|nr:LuxR family transcriptional regulator [Actinomycetota bacterium]